LVRHDCGIRIAENHERISITVTTFGSKRTVYVTVHEQTRPTEQTFCNIVHAKLEEHNNVAKKLAAQANQGVARVLRKRGNFYSMYGGRRGECTSHYDVGTCIFFSILEHYDDFNFIPMMVGTFC
jgi:hypothetical protein